MLESDPDGGGAASHGEASAEGSQATKRWRPLGEILVSRGKLDEAALQVTLQQQQRSGGLLGELLVVQGLVEDSDLIRALSEQSGVPFVSSTRLRHMDPPVQALAMLSLAQAQRLQVLPLAVKSKTFVCALRDPGDVGLLDELKFITGLGAIRGVYATAASIQRGIARFYLGEAFDAEPPLATWAPVGEVTFGQGAAAPLAVMASQALTTAQAQGSATAAALGEVRGHLLDGLLNLLGGYGALPGLARELAMRLGASEEEVESAAAAAQMLLVSAYLSGRAPLEIPPWESLEPLVGARGRTLLAFLEGKNPGPGGHGLGAALAFTERAGTAIPDPAHAELLSALARDQRVSPRAVIELTQMMREGSTAQA